MFERFEMNPERHTGVKVVATRPYGADDGGQVYASVLGKTLYLTAPEAVQLSTALAEAAVAATSPYTEEEIAAFKAEVASYLSASDVDAVETTEATDEPVTV